MAHEGRRYLGYEHVGENYDGPNAPDPEEYGIFGGCSTKLVELLGRGCLVLDLGAGLGPASITLARAGARTIAADISQRMLAVAARRAATERLDGALVFARMNAYSLPIAAASIDAVVANDVLHQLDNPEAAVAEVLRVLKPAGVFVQYGSAGLPVTDEQAGINRRCGDALNDIREHYREALLARGYGGLPYSSWDRVTASIAKCFTPPDVLRTGYEGVWTGAMAKGVHKLETRASGSAQLIPDAIHAAAWQDAHDYATRKYGTNYRDLPGYSRYTGILKVYRVRDRAA